MHVYDGTLSLDMGPRLYDVELSCHVCWIVLSALLKYGRETIFFGTTHFLEMRELLSVVILIEINILSHLSL